MSDNTEESMILEEEALIRAYEAELAILKQRSSSATTNAAGVPGEDADDDDLLEAMFTLPPSGSNNSSVVPLLPSDAPLFSSSNIIKQECLELTQSIQGFVFSSVETDATNIKAVNDVQVSPSFIKYIFRGHFLANPSVSACIRMTAEITRRKITYTKRSFQQQGGRPSKKQRFNNSSKVVSLEFSLSSSKGEDVSHIEASLLSRMNEKNGRQSKSLPYWLQTLSAYLEFEQQQQDCMLRWNRSRDEEKNHPYVCTQKMHTDHLGGSSRKATRPVCWIESSSRENSSSKRPTFIWEWDWSQERDILRMACSDDDKSEGEDDDSALSPQGLKDLVTYTGSCEKALDAILQTVNH